MAHICITTSEKSEKEQIKNKIHAHLFFDSEGVVHSEFVPQGHTVNQFYYREVLERLRKRVVRVQPSTADNWMLHHDNAPCYTAISVIEFLAKKGIPVVPQPPYSPDLSPCDFFLFPKLKFHLNPLAYTDGCQTAGLSRSIFTQPAVRRSEPSMSFLLIPAFCQ